MGGGLIVRTVILAITAGIVCASLVVLVFGIGFQVRGIWYALVPVALGSVVLIVLRTTMPPTDPGDDIPL